MGNQLKESLNLTDSECQIARLKALSNPVRLEILKFLHNGPSCVTLACLKLGISQPNISKHLQILKDAGIIDCRGNGVKHCYFICRPTVMGPLLTMFEQQHEYKPCSKPEQHE